MEDAPYDVRITETAEEHLKEVRTGKQQVKSKIQSLGFDPYAYGKRLSDELSHLHSARAGQYRIIYKVEDRVQIVFIKAVGLRREGNRGDIYEVATRLYGR